MVKPQKTALFAGVSSEGAGNWLNAIPSSTTVLRLESRQFQITAALRLGAPVCSQHKCACGEQVMSDGNHVLSCSKIKSRHSRHRQANDIINYALVSADYPSSLEPKGLCVSTAKRPDGMTLLPYIRGKPLVWDFTCSHRLAVSYASVSIQEDAKEAELAEARKYRTYEELSRNYIAPSKPLEALPLIYYPSYLSSTNE